MPDQDKEVTTTILSLLRLVIELRIDVEVLKGLTLFQARLQPEQFEVVRATARERWQPVFEILDRGDVEKSLLDILHNFEGPVQ